MEKVAFSHSIIDAPRGAEREKKPPSKCRVVGIARALRGRHVGSKPPRLFLFSFFFLLSPPVPTKLRLFSDERKEGTVLAL
jgi:hypothetical protein